MLSDLLSVLDYSDCAEAALVLFCFAFALMSYAAWRLTASAADRFASIPLFDHPVDPRDESQND